MKCISRLAAYGLVLVTCIAFAQPAAAAVTIYDNLGNGGNGFFGFGPNNWLAERFKSDSTNRPARRVRLYTTWATVVNVSSGSGPTTGLPNRSKRIPPTCGSPT